MVISKISELDIENIVSCFPSSIRKLLIKIEANYLKNIEEIRLRIDKPLMIISKNNDYFVELTGKVSRFPTNSYIVNHNEIYKTIDLLSNSSVYALEEEFKNGYITIKGGHRIGFTGKAVTEKGKLKIIKSISGINFRVSREIIGAADKVIDKIYKSSTKLKNTLIISPPNCGKTTLLRDLIRQISNGNESKGIRGLKVGIVDERSEIANCYEGKPQKNVGVRTDILDGCIKAEGIILLVRSMSPHVIATDEIGKKEDLLAVLEAKNCGVGIITTAHGSSINEIYSRPIFKEIINHKIFELFIVLNNKKGIGTLDTIKDYKEVEYSKKKEVVG